MQAERRRINPTSLRKLATQPAAAALTWPVARYIVSQRDRLSPLSEALPASALARLVPYFDHIDLERARIVQRDPLPIPDPPFYPLLRSLRLDFPSPSLVAAITFDHVIASREPMTVHTLFHELAHVVQYRVLGVRTFSKLYVRGFLAAFQYVSIPLERCAFELEDRFFSSARPFRVTAEIQRWAASGLF